MERKEPFLKDEIYHLFTRGVEKRKTCMDQRDYERFQLLLLLCNGKRSVRVADLIRTSQGEPLRKGLTLKKETIVDILAYAIMPNHIHLIVREKGSNGVSTFMLKLMTAYSMYFNTKYERSGPLFTRPFRSKHVDSDEYLRWIVAYVLLNPLELWQGDWKEQGLRDVEGAAQFLKTYAYSSFSDYREPLRPETAILNPRDFPIEMQAFHFDDMLRILAEESFKVSDNAPYASIAQV